MSKVLRIRGANGINLGPNLRVREDWLGQVANQRGGILPSFNFFFSSAPQLIGGLRVEPNYTVKSNLLY